MTTSQRSILPALLALSLVLLAPAALADGLPNMTPADCSDTGAALSGLQGGTTLGDFEQEPTERIQNGPCSWCTSNSSCSTACIDDNGNDSTCGDYGACDPCREALVEVGRQLIGQSAKETFWSICEFKWHYLVTYQSVNSTSCPTYTYCETETDTEYTWDVDVYCCDALPGGCFGQKC